MNAFMTTHQKSVWILICLWMLNCNTSNEEDNVAEQLAAFQATIDTKIEQVVGKQDSIRQAIQTQAITNPDTFALAKTLPPLNATKFLLESKYDEITESLKAYRKNAIDTDSLRHLLQSSTTYVENLMKENEPTAPK